MDCYNKENGNAMLMTRLTQWRIFKLSTTIMSGKEYYVRQGIYGNLNSCLQSAMDRQDKIALY